MRLGPLLPTGRGLTVSGDLSELKGGHNGMSRDGLSAFDVSKLATCCAIVLQLGPVPRIFDRAGG